MHGKTSVIEHDGKTLFAGVPNRIQVIRYHSLAALKMPEGFDVTARTAGKGVVMAMQHRELKMVGVQYHPESIKTEYGMEMLRNFVSWTGGKW